ncbi:2-amino-4-hydroxy-6-hydroxymethyldihydropteridine diphosphokinase [Flavobacteriaceae bacterium]|nr:2-amino-4-hydroxy-6-hydroxymethyldihydropteridine diphosphokinase [Flavobacteriaceae bacterium]
MTKKKQIYISLGSNQGDRLIYLVKALCFLESFGIKISLLSRIYETPPWGFESTPFYNACAQLQTELSPLQLMEVLLNVEQLLGRSRSISDGYTARTIDLDLLCYEEVELISDRLTLPHPRLELRNFVLHPLEEIAGGWIHPVFRKTISELKQASSDEAICNPFPFSFWSPPLFESYSYIVVEGNIGVGKSTLTKKLGAQYKAEILLETFVDNPYLASFYKDPKKYALAVETFFLNDKLAQTAQFWKHNSTKVVSDYFLNKSLVFATQNLSKDDFIIYQEEFSKAIKKQVNPTLMVYLHAEVPHLQKQIKKRGRPFEKEIQADYLMKIAKGYEKLIQTDLPFPVVNIAVDDLNFESDEAAFQSILRAIYKTTFL